ncbi:hypothetical protein [Frigoribacterium sp. SL97]|jgi:hypothetical protein|uniref:hypothetical protein n=1 Tax=Frigoribacterium sp. SL97 TaxID=2994664 RepID=UPI00226FC891|nr:hypothetical protein [Frigoribacterium sp. SL97]WAC50536.1 hypothetical protein OVA02_11700 [Frigoribacterium sp. SL97]
MDASTKSSIIVAAMTAAGPVGDDAEMWEALVLRNVRNITATLSDTDSNFGRAVDEIEGASKYVAVISLVKKEQKSTRGLVYLQPVPRIEGGVTPAPAYTFEQVLAIHEQQTAQRAAGKKPDDLPDGLEVIRTDRTDTGKDGLLMAKELTSLVGHRILVHKVMETSAKNEKIKVRVIKHAKDLGRYESYALPAPAAAPVAA